MTLDELQQLARTCADTGDYTAVDEALCSEIAGAGGDHIWAMLTIPANEEIHGDGQLSTQVVSAIVSRALELLDAKTLGIAVRMSQFHCAALIAGDIRKPEGQRALANARAELRAAWGEGDSRLRATIAHALAAAEVWGGNDDRLLRELLGSENPEVRALALLVHTAVGEGDRDAHLVQHLEHPSGLVRLIAAAGLAREAGPRPLAARTVAVLREAYRVPPDLPGWWVFEWFDGPETASELAERFLEEAGVAVTD